MKNKILLRIPQPCAEKWENMTASQLGSFCSVCQAQVVDFTTMSASDIRRYFKVVRHRTCGRFRANQLTPPVPPDSLKFPSLAFIRAGVFGLLVTLAAFPLNAQSLTGNQSTEHLILTNVTINRTLLRGIIRSEEDQAALPGVNILLKNTRIGTTSDAEGRFEFPQKLSGGDVLVFSFIGMERVEFVVPDEAPDVLEISVLMKYDTTIILGEVVVGQVYAEQPSAFRRFWGKLKGIF